MKHYRAILLFFLALFAFVGSSSAEDGSSILLKEGKPFFDAKADTMEVTPVLWNGRALLLASIRPFTSTHNPNELCLRILDADSKEVLAEFASGCSLASAFVENREGGDVLRVYAARQPEGETWFRDVVSFKTTDLKTWDESIVLYAEDEHLLNSSVCKDGDGYLAVYESDRPVGFCFKFARSSDLETWTKIPDLYYAGRDGATYSACPVVRKQGDYYYVIFLRQDGKGGYESAMIRSKDLQTWEESPCNPILTYCDGEGINNSDVDLYERDGRVEVFYAIGDQNKWCEVRRAFFNGTEKEFFEACYAPREFGRNDFTGDEKERVNIYVSKLGDDSDGKSWETAFNTVQKALNAIPDDKGGYRVVVRPDRYFEPNLLPSQSGAKGAYNELIGDFDGQYGGGATGWVYLDSSDPEKGYKSYDWFSSIRAYEKGWSPAHTEETISSRAWDRWIVRRVYATGGDAGLFWDCLKETEPFTILVEDCVSIGRAFGIGVAFGAFDPENPITRDDEPIVFRRVWAATLDRWGDAGAAFLRSVRPKLAEKPEFYLDDCTLVSPDNAVENNCAEYEGTTYVSLRRCRLIVLNFTQPAGDPPHTGVIRTPNDGDCYRVDLEDCDLMGCKIFSDEKPTPFQYTLKGRNRAYPQFNNPIPEGFELFEGWPVELFERTAPPKTPEQTP